MKFNLLLLIFAAIILEACFYEEAPVRFPVGEVNGYRPIYAFDDNLKISFVENSGIENPGKIYIYNTYLLLADTGKGIHVFDNSDRSNPNKIGLIQISGNIDIAMKGNIIYADQFSDIVAIDISDITNPTIISRQKNIYENNGLLSPQGYYFECIDPNLDQLVVGWELTTLNNPNCYR